MAVDKAKQFITRKVWGSKTVRQRPRPVTVSGCGGNLGLSTKLERAVAFVIVNNNIMEGNHENRGSRGIEAGLGKPIIWPTTCTRSRCSTSLLAVLIINIIALGAERTTPVGTKWDWAVAGLPS